jgi:kumamolisin
MNMASPNDPVALPGSGPPQTSDAHFVGPVDPNEPMTVTVTVRPRAPEATDAEIEKMSMESVRERDYPSRESFAAAHGADPDELKKVVDFARGHGLRVIETDVAKRRVVLAGKAADFVTAFGVKLDRDRHPGGEYRAASSPIHVPAELAPVVESVLGLDDRPVAHPRH